MNKLLSASPIWPKSGLTLVRIITGFFLIWHGWEIFSAAKMNEYTTWEMFKDSSTAKIFLYVGKASELIAGILLFLGLFTRLASIVIICTFSYISFFVGNGKIWYEDQHPFLFVLLGLVFFFCGSGKWSIDSYLFKSSN